MDPHRLPRLSLDLLRGFHAAARHLSFTRAAADRCVTQPAISREVRTLEQQLGVALFRRLNRSLQLTQAGQTLFLAVDEALKLIDDAACRVSGPRRTLAVTTTVALASTWLVPRLPRFTQHHPDIDMRVVASNDLVDLEREHIDVALRFVPAGQPAAPQSKLFDYRQFPVCSPALAHDRSRPLRAPADLSRHVLLDFETTVYGRPWYDWARWFDAMHIRDCRPVGSLRFSHYDQVIEAAMNGSGVAVGKHPHLIDHLRDGLLVAPFGEAGVATVGAFHLERARDAPAEAADAFVGWVREQVTEDEQWRRSRRR